jgi:hypothetical protein
VCLQVDRTFLGCAVLRRAVRRGRTFCGRSHPVGGGSLALRSKTRSASLRGVGEKGVVPGDSMGDGNSQGTGIARQPSEGARSDPKRKFYSPKHPAPLDVTRTWRIAFVEVAIGRKAPLQESPRQRPEYAPQPLFDCEREIAFTAEADILSLCDCHFTDVDNQRDLRSRFSRGTCFGGQTMLWGQLSRNSTRPDLRFT